MTDPSGATIVATTLDEAHAPGRTLLWCATFELAWNELRGAPGDPVILEPSSEMAAKLNASSVIRHDIDEASCTIALIDGGTSIDEIDASSSFREMMETAASQGNQVIYAKLDKSYPFKAPFQKSDDGTRLHFRGQPVESFGLWPLGPAEGSYEDFVASAEARKHVRVHHHRASDDFVVELLGEDPADRMIIARTTAAVTLAGTVRQVLATLTRTWIEGLELSSNDTLLIPKISLSRERDYEPLVNAQIRSGPRSGASIDQAKQQLGFELDERGATLLSEAAIELSYSAGPRSYRQFVCDGPFLLLLLRSDGRTPYLALWIENSEVLRTV